MAPLADAAGPEVWGVAVAARSVRASMRKVETATHLGITARGSRELGLRVTRDTYARINKRSSFYWTHEDAPELWDTVAERYEDTEHRIYTDAWCAELQAQALTNFDLNTAHFASIDHSQFDDALQRAVRSQRGMAGVTDLTKWDGVLGLYIMVLDEYRQAHVGATDHVGGVMARIKQHWAGTKQLDRLVFPDARTSILAIDSFRALDTTRIYALKTSLSFDDENPLLDQFPPEYMLNRIRGGRDEPSLGERVNDAVAKRRRVEDRHSRVSHWGEHIDCFKPRINPADSATTRDSPWH